MSKQDSSAVVDDLSLRLDVIDNALRTKYMRIVECLSMSELKKFKKFTYQEIIRSDISDLFPEVIYISNFLNNKVPKLCSERFGNQRTNGPVNAHLISWPSKAQNIHNLENIW